MAKKKTSYRGGITKARKPPQKKPLSRRFPEWSTPRRIGGVGLAGLAVVGGVFVLRAGSTFLPGAGHYEITNARVEQVEEQRRRRDQFLPGADLDAKVWKIKFRAEWVDGHDPGSTAHDCRYEVFDAQGNGLKTDQFGLR